MKCPPRKLSALFFFFWEQFVKTCTSPCLSDRLDIILKNPANVFEDVTDLIHGEAFGGTESNDFQQEVSLVNLQWSGSLVPLKGIAELLEKCGIA